MKCRRCGRDVPENANVCVHCNAPIQLQQNNAPKSNKPIIIAIIALVAVLVIMGIVYCVTNLTGGRKTFGGGGGGGSVSLNSAAFDMDVSRHDVALWSKDNVVYLYAHASALPESVNLIDENGAVVKPMNDDGNTAVNGDKVAGDGIFTAKLRMDTTEEGNYAYYALTENNVRSETQIISVIKSLTDNEVAKIAKVEQAITALKSTNSFKQKSAEERKTVISDKLTSLAGQGLIEADSIVYSDAGQAFTYYHRSGVVGVVKLYDFLDTASDRTTGKMNVYSASAQTEYNAQTAAAAKKVDARVLYAWGDIYNKAIKNADVYTNTLSVSNSCSNAGFSASRDENVTVEDMKKLAKYEFIYIGAHGLEVNLKRNADGRYWYGQRSAAQTNTTGFALMEKSTPEKDKQYSLALKSGRIFKVDGVYFITPGFFDEYYARDDFANSVFFFAGSQIMGAGSSICEDWTEVLDKKTAKAFIAFHNTAYINYGQMLAKDVAVKLAAGNTVQQALNFATQVNGNNDNEWYQMFKDEDAPIQETRIAAYPILRGDGDARLVSPAQ